MTLSPMIFKDYTWPHNPRVYEIEFKRSVAAHKVPFGLYMLQNLGRVNRVLRGEGEFSGEGAYDEFRKLATVFYEDKPGLLVHPLWQTSNAYFVSLSLRQEPRADYVAYAFEFWECFDGYDNGIKVIEKSAKPEPVESWYVVVRGDCLWNIATRNGVTLNALLALNPQIKNPNLIYVGDKIRIK